LNSFLFGCVISTFEAFQLAVVMEKRLFVDFGQDFFLVSFHQLKQQLRFIFWFNLTIFSIITWRWWLHWTNFV